jgi:hypothetical protein
MAFVPLDHQRVSATFEHEGSHAAGAVRWSVDRCFLAQLVGHGLMVAALVMWGGMFRLDAVDAPEIGGLFRFQDILAGLSGTALVFLFLTKNRWSSHWVAQVAIVFVIAVHATFIGLINGNKLVNIALELRPFLYLIAGILTAMMLYRPIIDRMLRLYATLMSVAILAQFVLLNAGSSLLFLTGAHLGNIFTLGLPIVRPQAFHLIGAGFILAVTRSGRSRFRLDTWIILVALIITQSKTYWLMGAFATILSILTDHSLSQASKLGLFGLGIVYLIMLAVLPAPVGDRIQSPLELVYKKFALVFQDENIGYGVIDVRMEEARLLLMPLDEPAALVFGRGFGYVYRDIGLFFYRENPRDLERLAMFGHNYYLWLLLKAGLVGVLLFACASVPVLLSLGSKDSDRRRFAAVFLAVLIGAATLGSMEGPTGAYLLGVLMACAVRPERRENKHARIIQKTTSIP